MTNRPLVRNLGIVAIAFGLVELVLVLERCWAAVMKAFKFNFDFKSPIYLNLDTVATFYLLAALFFVVCWFGSAQSRRASLNQKPFRIAIAFNLISVFLLTLLVAVNLARLS